MIMLRTDENKMVTHVTVFSALGVLGVLSVLKNF
jgi:hypothetical protein